MRPHNPYPWKSTFYWLFLPIVTILMPSMPTQCLSHISPQTLLHICHPPQLQDKVLVQGFYYSEPHYYSELSEHWVVTIFPFHILDTRVTHLCPPSPSYLFYNMLLFPFIHVLYAALHYFLSSLTLVSLTCCLPPFDTQLLHLCSLDSLTI